MTEITISVRGLVEFLLRGGDMDNRTGGGSEEAMAAGSRMHRKLQDAAEGDYRPEVPLEVLWRYPLNENTENIEGALSSEESAPVCDTELCLRTQGEREKQEDTIGDTNALCVHLQGRADGIYHGTNPEQTKGLWTIDEIKTTYRPLRKIKAPDPVHLAQAKCYAWMYASQNHLEKICVRMTYCNLLTEGVRHFYEESSMEELTEWFLTLMEQYRPWAEFTAGWQEKRQESIHQLTFPYPYREGQKELAAGVYRTIVHGRKLFLEAPTGTGKTISTLFPAVKAVGERKADRIFYLTAKTVTAAGAEGAVASMRTKGLSCKSVLLTAREKVCILDKPDCNPDSCERAKGHFDRINAAIYALITNEDSFTRETIAAYAEKYKVCPFELALDVSLFSDVIIGDYNYLFDPHAYLRRFFAEGSGGQRYIFLIDEAHNLVDRGREMYSAALPRRDVAQLRSKVKNVWPVLYKKLGRLSRKMRELVRTQGEEIEEASILHCDMHELGGLVVEADNEISGILSDQRIASQSGKLRNDPQREEKQALQTELLDFYFMLDHFCMIYQELDERYVTYFQKDGKEITAHLRCMDPSKKLQECMDLGRASVLFSATLLPITYYKALLGGTAEDYEIYAHSVFDKRRQGLYLVRDLTSKYQARNEATYAAIAECIAAVVSKRNGNYMAFFPSYSFLQRVAEKIEGLLPEEATLLLQRSGMQEQEREEFLGRFQEVSDERTLLGFCVLGGIFSEGIDLKRDALIGVMIVGTGIPQICTERELLKEYFDERGVSGYDYAYRFPGMNKVQQAAGRVIRTSEDLGIVVLIDERFVTPACRRLFPAEWSQAQITDSHSVARLAERFWDEWL